MEHKSKGESLEKCQAELKKLRRKSQGSKNPSKYGEKEIQVSPPTPCFCTKLTTVVVLVSLCACGLKLHQSVQNNDCILHKANHKTASVGAEAAVTRCPLSGKANSGGLIMSCAPLHSVCTSTHRQQAHRLTQDRESK